jgi:hypothetical protein
MRMNFAGVFSVRDTSNCWSTMSIDAFGRYRRDRRFACSRRDSPRIDIGPTREAAQNRQDGSPTMSVRGVKQIFRSKADDFRFLSLLGRGRLNLPVLQILTQFEEVAGSSLLKGADLETARVHHALWRRGDDVAKLGQPDK